MTGLPDGGREYIQTCGLASDAFWSDDLQDTAIELWEQSPPAAVDAVMEIYCENVRRAYCEMPLAMVEEWISVPTSEANFTRERCINCIDFKITAPTLDFLLAAGRESVTSIEPHAEVAPRIVTRADSVGLNGSPVDQPSAFNRIQSNRVS